jgi:hypothetical protein
MGRSGTCVEEATVGGAWAAAVEALAARLRRRFHRPEAAAHAADCRRGLVTEVERTTGRPVAERAGYVHPRASQRGLDRSAWAADAVRADRRASVVAEPADSAAVLVVEETGFPKQRRPSAGVARPYCGTLGTRANCQIGGGLGYAGPQGHVGLDRARSRPQAWADDRARWRRAAIADAVPCRTTPPLALARALVERALAAGAPAAWLAADAGAGTDRAGRRALAARGQASGRAGRRTEYGSTGPPSGAAAQHTTAALAARRAPEGWRRLRCGATRCGRAGTYHTEGARPGGMGPPAVWGGGPGAAPRRLGRWAAAPAAAGRPAGRRAGPPPPRAPRCAGRLPGGGPGRDRPGRGRPGGGRALAARRPVHAGAGAGRAGPRRGAHRAWLAPPQHARPAGAGGGDDQRPAQGGAAGGADCPAPLAVTVPELRRLLVRLLWAATRPPPAGGAVVAWSRWRRRHQQSAHACHRRRRLSQQGER